ncbi:hypothetical protein DRE_00130 [Drechslerella stenobrocha 248]|uniref:Zn(2)-C6 fungal-type domain-containing protein n=1 Tax=Drechslerella stenobrocha 248 TaxID=1043628 RepID=W7IHS6_9PEZI|nr:hypothetical protein DRE_00130 [Drechslerella stenobrocha 248]
MSAAVRTTGAVAQGDPSPTSMPRAFNCIICKNRKVKCDRQMPCSTCVKLNFECQYIEPGPRRKRKSSSKHENLLQRLNKYEELLRQVESNVKLLDSVEVPPLKRPKADSAITKPGDPERNSKKAKAKLPSMDTSSKKGQLLTTATGKTSRYYDNTLWNSLTDELQELKETIFEHSSDEDKTYDRQVQNHAAGFSNPDLGILLSSPFHAKIDLKSFHPSASHCVILWNLFLENVNPLTHIIHYPSLGEQVMKYKDCPHTMPPMPNLFSREARYRFAAQYALKNVGLLRTTDLVVLQGLVFFLLDLRSYYDYPSLWVVTGMAVRIAQRMGVHRDGAKLSLPPFEVEMRRRIWREILVLDFRTAELSGAGLYTMAIDESAWDSRWPTALNEEDLWPSMTHVPEERVGPTENMWCQLRSELGNIWVSKLRRLRLQGELQTATCHPGGYVKCLDSDEQVVAVSKLLEEKFLRYCDPAKPLHVFTSIVGRAALANLHLMTHHPIHYQNSGNSMPQELRDKSFHNAVRVIEYDNLCHSTRSLQRFMWHTKSFFQWHAFIYLLGDLRERVDGPDVTKAWEQVDEAFDNHKEWLEHKDELHSAIRAFALKAWECRVAVLKKTGGLETIKVPAFVQAFRSHAANGACGVPAAYARYDGLCHGGATAPPDYRFSKDGGMSGGSGMGTTPAGAGGNPSPNDPSSSATTTSGFTPINWAEWENLLQNADLLGFTGSIDRANCGTLYSWPDLSEI